MVAGIGAVWRGLRQLGSLGPTVGLNVAAAGVELTALRAVARAGYFAVQRDTIARRVGVVGIFPNEASIMRLIGASPGSGSWRQRQMNFQT